MRSVIGKSIGKRLSVGWSASIQNAKSIFLRKNGGDFIKKKYFDLDGKLELIYKEVKR